MNKIGTLSALAVAMAAGTAMAQPQLEFRLSDASSLQHDVTPVQLTDNGGIQTVRIIVEGRVNNWQQLTYQATTSGTTGVATIANSAAARDQIGWSILGLKIRTNEGAIAAAGKQRHLTKGVLSVDQYVGGGDPTLTSDPSWQSANSEVTHNGWTRFLRAGVAAQGDNTPGNGVEVPLLPGDVIGAAGNLALIGDGPDSDGTGPDFQNPAVAVTDLNLTADATRQGTQIGLSATGSTVGLGAFRPLYVLQYQTNDFQSDRLVDVMISVASDSQGNPIAGLYFRNPNSATNAGQATNETVLGATMASPLHFLIHINAVPAPGAAALLGIGGLMMGRRRRN